MIVAVPPAFPVIVIVVPLTDTVATPVALLVAVTVPLPLRVAVTFVLAPTLIDTELLDKLKLPAALPIVQFTDFAVVVPSLHS